MSPFSSPATVTLLFTDIEGSTRLVQAAESLFARALLDHRRILAAIFERTGGRVVDTQGDSFFVAFPRALDAVAAAAAVQREIASHPWPEESRIRVRIGLHTGEPAPSGEGFVGVDVNRAARIAEAAHGGQVLLSGSTKALVEGHLPAGLALRDLGEYRLRDLAGGHRLYELLIEGLPSEFPPVRTLSAGRNSLPVQLTSFVGREEACTLVQGLLEGSRLVTLTGPGGTGKTRLAVEAASGLLGAPSFSDGIWFVDLAPISDPALVAQALAAALGLREDAERPLLDTVVEALRERRLLLILDNCEHLIDPCIAVAGAILRGAPHVRFLVTGREALCIAGEQIYRVPSMTLPDSSDLDAVERSEAARLFVDRARAARPEFRLAEANAAAVAEICRRLDGIPLAIELAASRTRMLSVTEIGQRLDDRFRLLTGGSRASIARQQTLRALIDWSYDLLSKEEQALLRRLAVFAGGWRLEAAEEIGSGAAEDIFSTLTNLVDKSLVVVDGRGETTRYFLLETIRQYARDRLVESGETEAARDAHLASFTRLAARADAEIRGSDQRRWLARLDEEQENLRAALEWSGSAKRAEAQLRLASILWRYWRVRSRFSEGRRWLEEALGQSDGADDATRAKALLRAGSLASYQADYPRAALRLRKALVLYRTIGDPRGTADTLNVLANCTMMQGDFRAAEEMLDESLAASAGLADERGVCYARFFLGTLRMVQGELARGRTELEQALEGLESLRDDWWIANTRLQLAWIDARCGKLDEAFKALSEVLASVRELDDRRGEARALAYLAETSLAAGDRAASRRRILESLALFREIGDTWWEVGCLEGVAAVAALEAEVSLAARLLGACERFHELLAAPLLPVYRERLEGSLAALKAALPAPQLAALRQEGRGMSVEQAAVLALEAPGENGKGALNA